MWAQLVVGSLVAGSRNGSRFGDWSLFGVVHLWDEHRSLAWNLQANPELHQWTHRWMAWGIVLAAVVLFAFVWQRRHDLPQRLRLALHASGVFLLAQMALGRLQLAQARRTAAPHHTSHPATPTPTS